MRELFVYYRVPAAGARAAQATAIAAQAALRAAHPGLVARLLRRDDGVDAGQAAAATWMETYARPCVPPGVDEALQSAIESACAPLLALIDGARHVEAFVTDAPVDDAG